MSRAQSVPPNKIVQESNSCDFGSLPFKMYDHSSNKVNVQLYVKLSDQTAKNTN